MQGILTIQIHSFKDIIIPPLTPHYIQDLQDFFLPVWTTNPGRNRPVLKAVTLTWTS